VKIVFGNYLAVGETLREDAGDSDIGPPNACEFDQLLFVVDEVEMPVC